MTKVVLMNTELCLLRGFGAYWDSSLDQVEDAVSKQYRSLTSSSLRPPRMYNLSSSTDAE